MDNAAHSGAAVLDGPAPGDLEPVGPPRPTPRLQAALAAFQRRLPKLKFDSVANLGGGRAYRYASMHALLEAVVPALAELGVSVEQHPTHENGWVYITTVLSLGTESRSNTLGVPLLKGGFHELGSAITYLKRYSLSAMVGIAGEDDDDGHAAEGIEATTPEKEQGRSPAAKRQGKAKAGPPAGAEGSNSSPKAPAGDGVIEGTLVQRVSQSTSSKGRAFYKLLVDDGQGDPLAIYCWDTKLGEVIAGEVEAGLTVVCRYEPGDYPKLTDLTYYNAGGKLCLPGGGEVPF